MTPPMPAADTARTRGAAIARVLRPIVIDPVVEGRLLWHTWTPPIVAVSLASLCCYLFSAFVVIAPEAIRRLDGAVVGDDLVGLYSTMLVLTVCLWCIGMFYLASLAAHWVLKVAAVVIAVPAIAVPNIYLDTEIVGAIALGILIVYAAIRRGPRIRPVDVTVTMAVIGTSTLGIWIIDPPHHRAFGEDLEATWFAFTVSTISLLVLPTLLAAGGAMSQVAVATAESISALLSRSRRAWAMWIVIAGCATAALFEFGGSLLSGGIDQFAPAGTTILFGFAAAMFTAVWLVGRRNTPDPLAPGEISGRWSRFLYPLGIAMSAAALARLALLALEYGAHTFYLAPVAEFADFLQLQLTFVGHDIQAAALALGSFLVALVQAHRGHTTTGFLLSGFAAGQASRWVMLTPLIPFELHWSVTGLAFTATITGLVLMTIGLVRPPASTALQYAPFVLVFLGLAYAWRDLLNDPAGAVFGLVGGAGLMLGLIWRVLTDGAMTRTGTKALPVDSRVLLYWTSALFGVLCLMWLALARPLPDAVAGAASLADGDLGLGTPLILVVMVLAFTSSVRRGPTTLVPAPANSRPSLSMGQPPLPEYPPRP